MCKYCNRSGWGMTINEYEHTQEIIVNSKAMEIFDIDDMKESLVKVKSKYCFNCGRDLRVLQSENE